MYLISDYFSPLNPEYNGNGDGARLINSYAFPF